MYTRVGAITAKAYHFRCVTCKTSYWHSYSEKAGPDNQTLRKFYQPHSAKYLMMSSTTAFELAYIKEVVVDVELGRSFEDVTERFNRLYGSGAGRGDLYKTRVEDAFFVYKLLLFFKAEITVPIGTKSNRPDIDNLCNSAIEQVFSSGSEWVKHKCRVAGCSEGFVVCDGNEKLSRRICAAPRQHFKLSSHMPKITSKCGNSPVFGGQHQKASKYCEDHMHLENSDGTVAPTPKRILLTLNIPDQVVSTRIVDISSTLPSNDDTTVHIACKKAGNVKHYHDRTAGIMAIVRPCGIVIDWREMYTCESSSQLFIQLLKLIDEDSASIKFIGYDRACEFVPFLRNLKAKGNPGAEILLNASAYMVDNFHIAGHTTNACNPNHPDCEFHHSLRKFEEVANANTECAEQCFAWLKRFKSVVKYMTASRFRFFMHTVISSHNHTIEKRTTQ